MNNKRFRGIMPALPTAIDEENRFLPAAAEEMIKHLLKSPIRGLYINGATGEGPILPEKTRRENAELAVSLLRGRGAVINQIASPDSAESVRLARHAAEIGCDAVSSVVPNFFFRYPIPETLDYFRRIADASGLPVLVYANNLMGDLNAYDFMKRVMELPGVIGLKYTMTDYYQMQRITALNGGDINVINGPDETLLCGLIMGADGGIGSTYNVMPEWFCALYDAVCAYDIPRAQELQKKINTVITLMKEYHCLACVKTYYRRIGIGIGQLAYPGVRLTADEENEFMTRLRALGLPSLA